MPNMTKHPTKLPNTLSVAATYCPKSLYAFKSQPSPELPTCP